MSIGLLLLVILMLMLVGSLPNWRYSRGWGYAPSGGLGAMLIIVIVLMVMWRI